MSSTVKYWFVKGSKNPLHIYTHFPFAAGKFKENQVTQPTSEDEEKEFDKRVDDLKNNRGDMCYEVGEKLGCGSVAVVFYGREMWGLKREVAIKTMQKTHYTPKEARDIPEYKVCTILKHDNIVKMYDIFSDINRVFFIQEFINGPNLYDYVKTFEHFTPPFLESVDFSLQIATAIDHCHSNDVLHLDVKQENVMLHRTGDEKYVCKLCDFGWSAISKPGEMLKMKEVGSPLFHPPELIEHDFFDRSVDVWLIGYVMLELFTGCPKFEGEKEILYYKTLKMHQKDIRSLFWDDVGPTLKERHPQLSEKQIQFVIALLKSTMSVKKTHRVSAPIVVHLLENFKNVLFNNYA